jgi:hypothetical protein
LYGQTALTGINFPISDSPSDKRISWGNDTRLFYDLNRTNTTGILRIQFTQICHAARGISTLISQYMNGTFTTEFRFPFIGRILTSGAWPQPLRIQYVNGAFFFRLLKQPGIRVLKN